MQNWEEEKKQLVNQIQTLCNELKQLKKDIESKKTYYQKFKIIFENTKVGIGILDLKKNRVEINDSFKEMLNISQNIIIEHEKLSEYIYDEDIEKCIKLNRAAIKDRINYYETIIRVIPQNKTKMLWCKIVVSFVYENDNTPTNAVIILEDITDVHKREEHLRQKLEKTKHINIELGQFASVVAHDLKNPLAVITSYIRIMKTMYEDVLDEEGKEMTMKVYDRAEKMAEMIDSLLFYSRMSKDENIFRPCNLEYILNEALLNLETSIKNTGAVITNDKLPIVRGNKIQLTSLFQNLIENSIKYCEGKCPKIHISSEKIIEKTGWEKVIISITDNGIGIKSENKTKIFKIFNRVNESKYSGNGIGLASCKKIVERHNGNIWVESEPGKGSTFRFTLSFYDK